MSRGAKIVLIVLAVCASATVLMAGAGAVYVYQDGMIDIRIQEKSDDGANIHLFFPMTLARVALAFVPFEGCRGKCADAERYWPIVEAACNGIARSPDGVLVQVDREHEHVMIAKRGGHIEIDVDDVDAKVHVSIPVSGVQYVVRRMRPSSPGWGYRGTFTLSESDSPSPAKPTASAQATPARATPRA